MAREGARYLAIASVLRDRVKDGTYPSGEKLPRRVDLMEEFGASRALIDRAVGELEAEGLANSRGGPDNITVILIDVDAESGESTSPPGLVGAAAAL